MKVKQLFDIELGLLNWEKIVYDIKDDDSYLEDIHKEMLKVLFYLIREDLRAKLSKIKG